MRIGRSLLGCLVVLLATSCSPPTADLAVQSLGGPTPAPLFAGDPFELTNAICNVGTVPAGPSGVTFRLREAGNPATSTAIGWRPLPALAPGACDEQDTPLAVPFDALDGGYEIVAFADLERIVPDPHRANNGGLSEVFGVGYGPDLVVSGITAPPSASPGDFVPVAAEVCNRGTDWSAPTQLQIVLSPDETISIDPPQPDWFVGDLSVPDLFAGQCATVDGFMDTPSGVYHVGAIVDLVGSVFELIETNNTHVAGLIAIGLAPDLVVAKIEGPPSTTNGGFFQAQIEVCNQGTVSSGPTTVAVHFSADAVINPAFPDPASGDPMQGAYPVPPLDPGMCHSQSADANAWVPFDGVWTLGAIVDFDDQVAELLESNNARAGDVVGVGFGPDYIVTEIDAPPSANGNFDLEVEVCNQGTEWGESGIVRVHLSGDATFDPMPAGADIEIANQPAPLLGAGECSQVSLSAFIDSSIDLGPYWIVASADGYQDVAELIESNNDTWGGPIGIGDSPDYTITSIAGPASVQNGGDFEVSATVCNQGTNAMGPTRIAFYLSTDNQIVGSLTGPAPPPASDWFVGELDVPDLLIATCTTVIGTVNASVLIDGEYILGAIVDEPDWILELIETNNTFAGDLIGVGDGPDLRIESLTGPSSALPGASAMLDFKVCNVGTAMAGSSSLRLQLSRDAQIDAAMPGPDPWLDEIPVPMLDKSSCHTGSHSVWIPTDLFGAYYIGGIIDPSDAVPELIESNNPFAQSIIGIGNAPDYVVAQISVPPSATAFGVMPVSVEVCNQGTVSGDFASVALFLSDDSQLDGSYLLPGEDPILTVYPLPSLPEGACHTENLDTYPSVPTGPGSGPWQVIAVVDPDEFNLELREDNNESVSDVIGIGDAPDLIVASITVPPTVATGVSFAVMADVCNQGTTPAPAASLSLYHSTDATITGFFENPISPDLNLAVAWAPAIDAGACESVSVDVVSWVTPGEWYVGGIIDEEDSIAELIETNGTFVAEPHEVLP